MEYSKAQPSDELPDTKEPLPAAEEQELVKRAQSGDNDALTEIVLRNQRNVYNLGLRLGGSKEEAECILQETFLKVFEKIGEFRAESRLGTWIHRIATNVALMRIRSKKGKYFVPIEEQVSDDEEGFDMRFIARSDDRDPLEVTLSEERKVRLQQAILSLPEHLRTAFVLKDLEAFSLADISDRTGKSIPAVKADLHRARVRLRKELADLVGEGENV